MDIIRLEPNQIKKAAEVVASAFFNYPMLTHYFPDPKRRKQRLPWYMEKTLNCAMRYGEVFVPSDYSGVMFILPPGHTRLTVGEYIKNGFLFVSLVMGFRNYSRSDECEKFVADTQERLMNGRDHYYLWGLVADPKIQRKGIGSALLRILTDKADAEICRSILKPMIKIMLLITSGLALNLYIRIRFQGMGLIFGVCSGNKE